MNTIHKETTTVYTLQLSERRAIWLRSFIQNYPGPVDEEPVLDQVDRCELFKLLEEAKVPTR